MPETNPPSRTSALFSALIAFTALASAAFAQAPVEAVKLSAQGAFSNLSPRVGDSLDYVLQAEWEDTQVPVFVLAPDSLSFPGFKVIGQATVHKKLATAASVKNHTEFIYKLRAHTQGPGKASSIKLRYLTGMSRQEEAVFVPDALVDIAAAPVNPLDMLWVRLLFALIGFGALVFVARLAFKAAAKAKSAKGPKQPDLGPAVAALKSRLRAAQNSPDASQEILTEMEALSIRYLQDELDAAVAARGITQVTPAAMNGKVPAGRFEPLLDGYLKRNAATADAAEWSKLRELFRHARFAGGYKEPHELQDAFRTLRKCLKITGEDEA